MIWAMVRRSELGLAHNDNQVCGPAIMIDETTDINSQTELSAVLRYEPK